MTAPTSRPDIHAMLDAYAKLDVDHSANPAGIRHAYKQMARKHHPDRHPPGSEAQRQATERMAAINAAYQLARDAPLRHHRVATQSQPDVPWADVELDTAIRRARMERMSSNVAGVILVAAGLFTPWVVARLSGYQVSLGYVLAVMAPVYVMIFFSFWRGNGLWYLWRAFEFLRHYPGF